MNTRTIKRAKRSIIAALLAVIYLMISLSPLASLAMHSKSVAHTLTNECSGDCRICGCSAESMATRTCCCAKKKQQQENAAIQAEKQCFTPQAATAHTDAKRSCCPSSQPEKTAALKKDGCPKTRQHPHDEHKKQEAGLEAETTKPETVYKCGNPCGKSKMLHFTGTGTTETLPFIYTERIIPPYEDTRYSHLPQHMSTRHTEPPDPPPKI